MAKKVVKKSSKIQKKVFKSPFSIYWDKTNYYFLILGFALVIIGFYTMSLGNWNSFSSLVISPIILFLAYIVVFPLSIWYRKKKVTSASEEEIASGQS